MRKGTLRTISSGSPVDVVRREAWNKRTRSELVLDCGFDARLRARHKVKYVCWLLFFCKEVYWLTEDVNMYIPHLHIYVC